MSAVGAAHCQLRRVSHRWWSVLAYGLVVAMGAVGLYRIDDLSKARSRDNVDKLVSDCELTNTNRANSNERLRNLLVYLIGSNTTPRTVEILAYYDSTTPPQTDCSKLRR